MLKIGDLQVRLPAVQAALSGYSDRAMRLVARRRGAELCMAEVVLDKLVLVKGKLRDRLLSIGPDDHPIGGQLMGAEPEQSGKKAWAHPVVFGGKLYVRDHDLLLCYDVKGK